MKCPSCGVWNRAHFTKCILCGADLTGAHADGPAELDPKELADEEALARAVAEQLQRVQQEPQVQAPAKEKSPAAEDAKPEASAEQASAE